MNHVLRLVGATHRQHIILPIFSDYSLFQDDGRQQQLADALQLLNRGLDMLRYPKPIKSIGISSFHHYKLDDTVGTSFTIFFWLPASCPSSLHILIPSSFLDITLRRAMKITREFFCGQLEHFIAVLTLFISASLDILRYQGIQKLVISFRKEASFTVSSTISSSSFDPLLKYDPTGAFISRKTHKFT